VAPVRVAEALATEALAAGSAGRGAGGRSGCGHRFGWAVGWGERRSPARMCDALRNGQGVDL